SLRALGGGVELPGLERAPRQARERVVGVVGLRVPVENGLVALLGRWDALATELRLAEEPQDRDREIVLAAVERAAEGFLGLGAVAGLELALPEAERDLGPELEVAQGGELLELWGRLLGLV